MASKSTQHLNVEEEEMRNSIQCLESDDSDGEQPPTAAQKVRTPAPSQTHSQTKKQKASGTPLPEGHGSTHKKGGNQIPSLALKKAKIVPKSSDSGQETGTDKSRHRLV
ncbi:hypothetical protein NDU88_004371 [Pleurodeles waltl]|uniref:Uncharacterized protein n=1 Tax=Pleurodeles waltl TaxID=8319 RepID=A0AAV7VGW4_PLEWA|nr:hypothetical protein NDU88_004371 [Pleurodeles waltl]